MKMLRSKGFTLIELLVVVAIIGILSSLIFLNIRDAQSKSRDSKRKTEIGDIKKALESFRIDTGRYAKCDTVNQTGSQCGFADGSGGVIASLWNASTRGLLSGDVVKLNELIRPFPYDPKINLPYVYATSDPTTPTDGYYGSYAFAVALENSAGLTYTDKLEAIDGKSYYKCRTGENYINIAYYSDWFNHPTGSPELGQPCNF